MSKQTIENILATTKKVHSSDGTDGYKRKRHTFLEISLNHGFFQEISAKKTWVKSFFLTQRINERNESAIKHWDLIV